MYLLKRIVYVIFSMFVFKRNGFTRGHLLEIYLGYHISTGLSIILKIFQAMHVIGSTYRNTRASYLPLKMVGSLISIRCT